jgi:hypothetical protein
MKILSDQERQTLCCDICGNKLKSEKGLRIHYSTVHKSAEVVEGPPTVTAIQEAVGIPIVSEQEPALVQELEGETIACISVRTSHVFVHMHAL